MAEVVVSDNAHGPQTDVTSATQRILTVAGFANLRDVGGYPATGGRVTRWGVLLRSDLPRGVGPGGLAPLAALGVGRVLDLRAADEVAETPSPFAAAGFTVTSRPVFHGSATSFVANRITLPELYEHMLTDCGTTLTEGVRAVAADPSPVLVHCSAGKDRTGLLVALVLTAVGVDRHAVIRDYALTGSLLRGRWLDDRLAELRSYHDDAVDNQAELLAGSPPSAIDTSLRRITDGWGSAAGFLRAHGMTTGELTDLRDLLTEPRTAP